MRLGDAAPDPGFASQQLQAARVGVPGRFEQLERVAGLPRIAAPRRSGLIDPRELPFADQADGFPAPGQYGERRLRARGRRGTGTKRQSR